MRVAVERDHRFRWKMIAQSVRLTYPRRFVPHLKYRLAQKLESHLGSTGNPNSDALANREGGGTHGAGLRYRRSAGS